MITGKRSHAQVFPDCGVCTKCLVMMRWRQIGIIGVALLYLGAEVAVSYVGYRLLRHSWLIACIFLFVSSWFLTSCMQEGMASLIEDVRRHLTASWGACDDIKTPSPRIESEDFHGF